MQLHLHTFLQITERNKGWEIPLHHAARRGDERMVHKLLQHSPEDSIGRSIHPMNIH